MEVETKERISYIIGILVLAWVIMALANGCSKPQPPNRAVLAPEATVSCPAGYKALGKHEGRRERGIGYITIPYKAKGNPHHLVCTQDDGVPDARISKSTSGSIPDSK